MQLYTSLCTCIIYSKKKSRERGNFFSFFTRRNRQPLGLCSFTAAAVTKKKKLPQPSISFITWDTARRERERAKNGNREEDDQVRVCKNLFSIRARHEQRERETRAENRKSSKAGIWRTDQKNWENKIWIKKKILGMIWHDPNYFAR